MAQTRSKPAIDLTTAHAYAVGWNDAIRAAVKICKGAATYGDTSRLSVLEAIQKLDRSMQAIDD